MPVTMPGSAMGRITRSEIASLPAKRPRATAAAQSVPRRRARNVEIEAISTESRSADQTSGRSHVTTNQRRVNPGGGQTKLRSSVVNA